MKLLRSLASEVADLLFPIACIGCGRYAGEELAGSADRWLCTLCRGRITPARPACAVCGALTVTGHTCYRCVGSTPLTGIVVAGHYRDPILRAAIWHLKFSHVRELAEPLGTLLAARLTAVGLARRGTMLVPIPLHPKRLRERGFNQARLLAEQIADKLKLPVVEALARTRATDPQTSLRGSPAVRDANVRGAFRLRIPIAGNHPTDYRHPNRASVFPTLVLVDDVLTTGSTLNEAARVLVGSGIREIWAAAVARG